MTNGFVPLFMVSKVINEVTYRLANQKTNPANSVAPFYGVDKLMVLDDCSFGIGLPRNQDYSPMLVDGAVKNVALYTLYGAKWVNGLIDMAAHDMSMVMVDLTMGHISNLYLSNLAISASLGQGKSQLVFLLSSSAAG